MQVLSISPSADCNRRASLRVCAILPTPKGYPRNRRRRHDDLVHIKIRIGELDHDTSLLFVLFVRPFISKEKAVHPSRSNPLK